MAATIEGKVPIAPVTVNKKGGSTAIILKKEIRGDDFTGGTGYAARMEFADGVACVLLAPGEIAAEATAADAPDARVFRVTPVTGHSFLIDFGAPQEAKIDPVTLAILTLLEKKMAAGKTDLMTDAEMRTELDALVSDGEAIVAQAKARRARAE
jgi:hypothetical protein